MVGSTTAIAWLVSVIVMAGAWITLFARAEGHVSELTKRQVRRWFLRLDADPKNPPGFGWADSLLAVFDQIFGARWGLRFVARSILATLIFFGAVMALFYGLGMVSWADFRDFAFRFSDDRVPSILGAGWHRVDWLITILAGNLVIDLVSLTQTRWFLGLMAGKRLWVQALGLVLDLVVTFAIFWVLSAWFFLIEALWQNPAYTFAEHLIRIIPYEIFGPSELAADAGKNYRFVSELLRNDLGWNDFPFYPQAYQAALITTFFTSVWIWLFLLAGLLGRVAFALRGGLTRFGRIFDVQAHPIATLGYVLALLTVAIHCAILLIAGFFA